MNFVNFTSNGSYWRNVQILIKLSLYLLWWDIFKNYRQPGSCRILFCYHSEISTLSDKNFRVHNPKIHPRSKYAVKVSDRFQNKMALRGAINNVTWRHFFREMARIGVRLATWCHVAPFFGANSANWRHLLAPISKKRRHHFSIKTPIVFFRQLAPIAPFYWRQ